MKFRQEIRHARHSKKTPWYIARLFRFGIRKRFSNGILRNVVFQPNAKAMRHDMAFLSLCGLPQESIGTARGFLEQIDENPDVPARASRTCPVGYDPKRPAFFNKDNPSEVLTSADFLVLIGDHQAIAGWYE